MKKRFLVIGANGTIGSKLASQLESAGQVIRITQEGCDYQDESLAELAAQIKKQGHLDQIYCCIGVLHNHMLSPEKRLSQIEGEKLAEYFRINAILPALCIKYFSALLTKESPSQFVLLSAMVGSITDNQLGGWYGYRASKAALNMLLKTAAIELWRSNKNSALAVIHPGTTQGVLSKPFSGRIAEDKYYSPAQSAQRIIAVADDLRADDTGKFFNWDGSQLSW